MKKKKTDTLHLVLKAKWYDMIANGEKKAEYREIKDYWCERLDPAPCPYFYNRSTMTATNMGLAYCARSSFPCALADATNAYAHIYKYVTFHRGYTNTTMTFKYGKLVVGKPNPDWCEPEMRDKQVFIINLGERVK